jgi:hypothetical protein
VSARPAGKRDTATVVILSPPPPPPLPLSLWQVVSGAQLTAAGDAVLAGVRGLLATETVELGAAAQVAPEPAIQAPFNPIQPHSTPFNPLFSSRAQAAGLPQRASRQPWTGQPFPVTGYFNTGMECY